MHVRALIIVTGIHFFDFSLGLINIYAVSEFVFSLHVCVCVYPCD